MTNQQQNNKFKKNILVSNNLIKVTAYLLETFYVIAFLRKRCQITVQSTYCVSLMFINGCFDVVFSATKAIFLG